MSRIIKTLLIVSHVQHYRFKGTLFAYGPFVREIDIWADLFPELIIAAPCCDEIPPGDCISFTRPNIAIIPQKRTGGNDLLAKVFQIISLPVLIWDLGKAMRQVDAIHVRCPGNLGLLGVIMSPLFSDYLVAKYAGNWKGHPGESWTYRLQRKILRSNWWHGPVTVYGRWSDQPSNVVPFFTSIMNDAHLARGKAVALRRSYKNPLQIIYVGRLSKEKNVDKLLSAIYQLNTQGINIKCIIVGEGVMRSSLENQVTKLGLFNQISFTGGVDFEQVLEFYEESDILVLVSETEGWPKAIAEAMAFGLICIGSDRGWVPEMLGEGRGIVVPPGNVGALTDVLREIAMAPEEFKQMSISAAAWAEQYSLEGLREALSNLLADSWKVNLYPQYRPID